MVVQWCCRAVQVQWLQWLQPLGVHCTCSRCKGFYGSRATHCTPRSSAGRLASWLVVGSSRAWVDAGQAAPTSACAVGGRAAPDSSFWVGSKTAGTSAGTREEGVVGIEAGLEAGPVSFGSKLWETMARGGCMASGMDSDWGAWRSLGGVRGDAQLRGWWCGGGRGRRTGHNIILAHTATVPCTITPSYANTLPCRNIVRQYHTDTSYSTHSLGVAAHRHALSQCDTIALRWPDTYVSAHQRTVPAPCRPSGWPGRGSRAIGALCCGSE